MVTPASKLSTEKDQLATIRYGFSGGKLTSGSAATTLLDFTLREITLAESLLTPGLQTSIKFQSAVHTPQKNYDDFKNSIIQMSIDRPILEKDPWNFKSFLEVNQRVYRISNRKLFNNNTEELTIHACDDSLLDDARNLISKTWPCGTSPSQIVQDVLTKCLKVPVNRMQIESSAPPIMYIAENNHHY